MFIPNQKALLRIFEFSISGTRGGPVRLEILRLLAKNNMNINQISARLRLDYKTVQHHMRVLEKSGFVGKKMVNNENIYMLSALIRSNNEIMKLIWKDIGKK